MLSSRAPESCLSPERPGTSRPRPGRASTPPAGGRRSEAQGWAPASHPARRHRFKASSNSLIKTQLSSHLSLGRLTAVRLDAYARGPSLLRKPPERGIQCFPPPWGPSKVAVTNFPKGIPGRFQEPDGEESSKPGFQWTWTHPASSSGTQARRQGGRELRTADLGGVIPARRSGVSSQDTQWKQADSGSEYRGWEGAAA